MGRKRRRKNPSPEPKYHAVIAPCDRIKDDIYPGIVRAAAEWRPVDHTRRGASEMDRNSNPRP